MSNTILLKRSSVANAVPSAGNLALGELAINTSDSRLFAKNAGGSIIDLTGVILTGDITANGTTGSGNIVTTLSNTAVSAGTYGSASEIPSFTVDSKGRITNATTFSIDTAQIANGTSNVNIGAANGDITMAVNGTSNVVVVSDNQVVVAGNITADNFVGNITGNITISGANTEVIFNDAGLAAGNTGFTFDKAIGQVNISGNTYVGNILTDGYFYANGAPVDFQQPAGANTQVQFNDNSDFGASAAFTFDSAANVLTVGGNIDGANLNVTDAVTAGTTITATGNVSGGNITTAGDVTTATVTASGNIDATGNVTGGNLVAVGDVSGATLTISGNIDGANLNVTDAVTAGTTVTATGNVSGGNITTAGDVTTATVTASGNVSGGNLTTAGDVTTATVTASSTVTATGNVSGGNITTAGRVVATGNVTGGNITTGGQVTATGNITGGNIATAGRVVATGNITGGNLVTAANVDGGNINSAFFGSAADLQISAIGNVFIDATGGVIDMGGLEVTNVGTPTGATDAATKQYVDDAVSTGITIHPPVRLESPNSAGSLNATYAQGGNTYSVTDTIAGNTVVFSTAANLQPNDQLWFSNSFQGIAANVAYFVVSAPNTSAAVLSTTYSGVPVSNITSGTGLTQSVRVNSGQGATLTNAGANAALSIDGVTVSTNNRVLIYSQSNGYENGVYVVTVAGDAGNAWVLTRSSDMNTYIPNDINGVDAGDYFFVQEGDTGAGEAYVMTAPIGPLIIGFDTLTFSQFSASQVYTANTNAGLSLTGTVFAAKVDLDTTAFDLGGNIKVKDGANLVTPNIGDATGNSLTLSGNGAISAVTLVTSGNIDGGNIIATGLVSTADLTASQTITATGNIDGGNIITLGTVAATGNVSGGNLVTSGDVTTATVTASGNIDGGNLVTSGDVTTATVTASGNIDGGNLNVTNITGTLLTAAQPNITSLGNLALANVGTLTVSVLANIIATTPATSNVTGALIVSGGVGITGNLYADDIYKDGVTVLNADDTVDGGLF